MTVEYLTRSGNRIPEHGVQNKPGANRCKECGFRKRGKGHDEGAHHNHRLGSRRHAIKR